MKKVNRIISIMLIFYLMIVSVNVRDVKASEKGVYVHTNSDYITYGGMMVSKEKIWFYVSPNTGYKFVSAKVIVDGKDEYDCTYEQEEDMWVASILSDNYAEGEHVVEAIAKDKNGNEYRNTDEFKKVKMVYPRLIIPVREDNLIGSKAEVTVTVPDAQPNQTYNINLYVNYNLVATGTNEIKEVIDLSNVTFQTNISVQVLVNDYEISNAYEQVYVDPLNCLTKEYEVTGNVVDYRNDRIIYYAGNSKYNFKNVKTGEFGYFAEDVDGVLLSDNGSMTYNSTKKRLTFKIPTKFEQVYYSNTFSRIGDEIIYDDKISNQIIAVNMNTLDKRQIFKDAELIYAKEGAGIVIKKNNNLYAYDGKNLDLLSNDALNVTKIRGDKGSWSFQKLEKGLEDSKEYNCLYFYQNGKLSLVRKRVKYNSFDEDFEYDVIDGKLYYLKRILGNEQVFCIDDDKEAQISYWTRDSIFALLGKDGEAIKVKAQRKTSGEQYIGVLDGDGGVVKVPENCILDSGNNTKYKYNTIVNGEKYLFYKNSVYKINNPAKIIKEDFNNDGVVDMLDMALISEKYNFIDISYGYDSKFDINSDGIIDISDLVSVGSKILGE